MFAGSGGSAGNTRLILLSWSLVFFAVVSLIVAIVNTTYTYIKYNDVKDTCPDGDIINECPVKFVYISSGIWCSIPASATGLVVIRLNRNSMMVRLLFALAITSLLIFTPAMMVISAIEIVAENKVHYRINGDGITGDVTKFILPLVVVIMAAIEFLILLLMVCYMFRNHRNNAGGARSYGRVAMAPLGGGYGSFEVGFVVPTGHGGGYNDGYAWYDDEGSFGDDFHGGRDDGGNIDDLSYIDLDAGGFGGGYGAGPPVMNSILMEGGGTGGGNTTYGPVITNLQAAGPMIYGSGEQAQAVPAMIVPGPPSPPLPYLLELFGVRPRNYNQWLYQSPHPLQYQDQFYYPPHPLDTTQ